MESTETTEQLRDLPIVDIGEPLVDFVRAGLHFAPRHPVFPFPRVHLLRRGMVERLLAAQERLPEDWTLIIVEGFRPLEVQRLQHEANRRRFMKTHAHLPPEKLQALLEDFSAPPDIPEVPPPHSTGGAVDVHILDANGEMVDLVSPFTLDQTTEAAAWEAPVSAAARRNREILKAAMESAGITNYPAEFWHWSYGDQGWAYRGGHPRAVYGRLTGTVAEAEAIQGEPANRAEPMRAWPTDLPQEGSV